MTLFKYINDYTMVCKSLVFLYHHESLYKIWFYIVKFMFSIIMQQKIQSMET